MKNIPLTKGFEAIVDDEDYAELAQYSWNAYIQKGKKTIYAQRTVGNTTQKMHRLILKLTDPNVFVDHINGNGLDNRRCNLRACNKYESSQNRSIFNSNTSGFKGVKWHKRIKKYAASINFQGRRMHLGYFENPLEAHIVYNKKAEELFKQFKRREDEEKTRD